MPSALAQGKSMCYELPVINAISGKPPREPQGSELKRGLENSWRNFNKLFGISQVLSSADCI
jgi:hypothetical protein